MSSDSRDKTIRADKRAAPGGADTLEDDVFPEEEQDMSVDELKQKIESGEYRVNYKRLAATMLQHPDRPMRSPKKGGTQK